MESVCRVTAGIGGHLGGGVETWYNGHFLESVRVTLVRTPNNGKYKKSEPAGFYNQARLSSVGTGFHSIGSLSRHQESPLEISKYPRLMLGLRLKIENFPWGPITEDSFFSVH